MKFGKKETQIIALARNLGRDVMHADAVEVGLAPNAQRAANFFRQLCRKRVFRRVGGKPRSRTDRLRYRLVERVAESDRRIRAAALRALFELAPHAEINKALDQGHSDGEHNKQIIAGFAEVMRKQNVQKVFLDLETGECRLIYSHEEVVKL